MPERELFLTTAKLNDAEGQLCTVDYYITIDEMDVGPFFCESYGLRVECRESGEVCTVPHITCRIDRISQLSELVALGGVTPVTLPDVVSDWL